VLVAVYLREGHLSGILLPVDVARPDPRRPWANVEEWQMSFRQLDCSASNLAIRLGAFRPVSAIRRKAVLRNVVNEVNLFAFYGLQAGLTLLSECLVLASVGTLLLIVDRWETLALLAVLGGASWGFHRLHGRRTLARGGLSRQHHEGLRLQHLQQGLACVRELKLLGRETGSWNRCHVHTTQGSSAGQRMAMSAATAATVARVAGGR